MKTTKQRVTALLLLLAVLLTAAACGAKETNDPAAASAAVATETEPPETEKQYDYKGKNYDGYKFTILNFEAMWGTHLRLAPEELNGESLNDAMFDRNKKIEDALNLKITEDKKVSSELGSYGTAQTALCTIVETAVLAGDAIYDAASFCNNQ